MKRNASHQREVQVIEEIVWLREERVGDSHLKDTIEGVEERSRGCGLEMGERYEIAKFWEEGED